MGTAAGVKDIAARGGSAAVIPQACRQVLQHMREAADKYDMQLKVRLWPNKDCYSTVIAYQLGGSRIVADA